MIICSKHGIFINADSGAILTQFQTLYHDSDLRKELENVKVIPSLLQKLYELDLVDALPLVTTICDLASSTAITSVACERSFSVLRRIKNYQRNKMEQDLYRCENEEFCKDDPASPSRGASVDRCISI